MLHKFLMGGGILSGGTSSPTIEAPTIQASNLIISNVTSTSFTVTLVNGNGTGTLLLAKANSEITTFPTDNTEYIADSIFGNGDEIDGAYVVGNGIGPSFNITNLTPGDSISLRAFEYNND
jgi:hypothetical protein